MLESPKYGRWSVVWQSFAVLMIWWYVTGLHFLTNIYGHISSITVFYWKLTIDDPLHWQNRRVALITNVKSGKLRDVVSEGLVTF